MHYGNIYFKLLLVVVCVCVVYSGQDDEDFYAKYVLENEKLLGNGVKSTEKMNYAAESVIGDKRKP